MLLVEIDINVGFSWRKIWKKEFILYEDVFYMLKYLLTKKALCKRNVAWGDYQEKHGGNVKS